MKGNAKEIERAAKAVGKGIEKTAEKQYKNVTEKIVKEGALPKDALGLSDAMIEGIYGQAYRLYNTGKYQDAAQLFRLLIMINAAESKYAMGLAACLHMLKEYKNAVEAYTLCSIIDPKSPVPHYHASDCYLQLKDKRSALVALEMTVKRAGERKEYVTIKDRALMTMESIKKELKKQP